MIAITIVPSSDGHALFTATLSNGYVLVERSRQPLLDAARALLAQSTSYSTHAVVMLHQGSTAIALQGTVGQCAKLTVAEGPWGPVFRAYTPIQQPATLLESSTA